MWLLFDCCVFVVFVVGGGNMQSLRQQLLLRSWSTKGTFCSKQDVWPLPVCSGELAMVWLLFDCCVFVAFVVVGGDQQLPTQQLLLQSDAMLNGHNPRQTSPMLFVHD